MLKPKGKMKFFISTVDRQSVARGLWLKTYSAATVIHIDLKVHRKGINLPSIWRDSG